MCVPPDEWLLRALPLAPEEPMSITGVLGAYQDNYPMLVISGQVRYETTVDSTGLPLRFLGEQEHDIVDTVRPLTKYAVMVKRPEDVRYEIEKAMHIALDGAARPLLGRCAPEHSKCRPRIRHPCALMYRKMLKPHGIVHASLRK